MILILISSLFVIVIKIDAHNHVKGKDKKVGKKWKRKRISKNSIPKLDSFKFL